MRVGKIIETQHQPTLADGVSGGIDNDTITFDICKSTVDELLWCNEDEITKSFLKFAFDEHQIVEGSAALALAGYEQVYSDLADQTSIVISCGANIDRFPTYSSSAHPVALFWQPTCSGVTPSSPRVCSSRVLCS